MNNLLRISIIAASLALAATFVAWRVHVAHTRATVQFEIVKDPSGSATDGCDTLIGLAEGIMTVHGVTEKSELTVLMVGDAVSADEPTVLGSYPIPFNTKVIEGRGANRRRQAAVLKDLLRKCQSARTTGISPIFMAVKQAIADLRGKGCDTDSHCQLFVDSDLEENVELAIKSRLAGVGGKQPPLPATIDNSNIAVSFCGLAATTGRIVDSHGREIQKLAMRDPNREDRLKATWKALFVSPNLVNFNPYCPRAADMAEYRAGADAPSPN